MRTYDANEFEREKPEDVRRCIEVVRGWNGWHHPQCSRKRGFGEDGLYCKQHARKHLAKEVA